MPKKYYAYYTERSEDFPPDITSVCNTRAEAEEEAEELIDFGDENVTVIIAEVIPIARMEREVAYKTTPIEPVPPAKKPAKKGAK